MRQTSAPRGFSLLELLVVVAVLGIVLAATSLSIFQAESRRLALEADRLIAVLTTAADRAALLNRPHRLVIQPDGYFTQEFFRGDWRADLPAPLIPRGFAEPVRLASPPQVIRIDRSGLIEASRLTLVRGADLLELEIGPLGGVVRRRPGQGTPVALPTQGGLPAGSPQ